MVSSPSLEYDPEDEDQYRVPPTPPTQLGLQEPAAELDPLEKARKLLDELLEMSCEVPLHEVNDMAEDSGVKTSEILNWAEKSDSCFIDWISGHIRCNDEPAKKDEGDDGYYSKAVR